VKEKDGIIVIGASKGGIRAVGPILTGLPGRFPRRRTCGMGMMEAFFNALEGDSQGSAPRNRLAGMILTRPSRRSSDPLRETW
jgi:hypothetical protein